MGKGWTLQNGLSLIGIIIIIFGGGSTSAYFQYKQSSNSGRIDKLEQSDKDHDLRLHAEEKDTALKTLSYSQMVKDVGEIKDLMKLNAGEDKELKDLMRQILKQQ